jgi:hypothetical protein
MLIPLFLCALNVLFLYQTDRLEPTVLIQGASSSHLQLTRMLAFYASSGMAQVMGPILQVFWNTHTLCPHIWWCPVAEFTLIPLCTAGPYEPNSHNYISSYTPTLVPNFSTCFRPTFCNHQLSEPRKERASVCRWRVRCCGSACHTLSKFTSHADNGTVVWSIRCIKENSGFTCRVW